MVHHSSAKGLRRGASRRGLQKPPAWEGGEKVEGLKGGFEKGEASQGGFKGASEGGFKGASEGLRGGLRRLGL